MSRAALWKQEEKVKAREARADELYRTVVEKGRASSKKALPLWGADDGTFHINQLLLQNIIHMPYFQKCCENLQDWNAIIDEIYYECKHVLPFQTGKTPSTAFCLLLRLLALRMTPRQLELTLQHPDSPYIRCIGFLYLRYVGPPDQVWDWINPYVHDREEFSVKGRPSDLTTIGEYVRRLFSDQNYYGTTLPRLPCERELRAHILQADSIAERAERHFKNSQRIKYFATLGSKVMALYGDEENPVEWYEAIVDRVIQPEIPGDHPKYIVSFLEYGNTETVSLGEMDVLDGDWIKSRCGGSTGGDRGGNDHWYEEARRKESATATASKGWARKPPSTKASLATVTATTHDDDDDRGYNGPRRQERRPPRGDHSQKNQQRAGSSSSPTTTSAATVPPRKRTPEELAAAAEKKRRLMAKYG